MVHRVGQSPVDQDGYHGQRQSGGVGDAARHAVLRPDGRKAGRTRGRMTVKSLISVSTAVLLALSVTIAAAQDYDLVILNGRVIDLHSHGVDLPGNRMQAFDGVTTALELESGLLPISKWYEHVANEGRATNSGATVSWDRCDDSRNAAGRADSQVVPERFRPSAVDNGRHDRRGTRIDCRRDPILYPPGRYSSGEWRPAQGHRRPDQTRRKPRADHEGREDLQEHGQLTPSGKEPAEPFKFMA